VPESCIWHIIICVFGGYSSPLQRHPLASLRASVAPLLPSSFLAMSSPVIPRGPNPCCIPPYALGRSAQGGFRPRLRADYGSVGRVRRPPLKPPPPGLGSGSLGLVPRFRYTDDLASLDSKPPRGDLVRSLQMVSVGSPTPHIGGLPSFPFYFMI